MAHSLETEKLWRRMHDGLLSYVLRHVGSHHDAEDILQDVFVRIHANLASLKETQSVTAWVYRIARNAITDHHRKRAATERAISGLAGTDGAESADDGPDVTQGAVAEFAGCIRPMLDELQEHHRQAITLTELAGMSQKNAAEAAGLSVAGMKARVQRARSKLKDAILGCCQVELDRRGGLVDYERREGGADCDKCDCD